MIVLTFTDHQSTRCSSSRVEKEKFTVGSKRKRAVLTLEKKLEILKSDCLNLLSEKTSICRHLEGHRKITFAIAASESPAFLNKKQYFIHPQWFDLVDQACWRWFFQQKRK